MPNDTHPEVHRVHIEMLREAGPTRRSQIASELTHRALRQARQGIANAHPELSQREQDLLFARVHYGPELADRLRDFLKRRAAS